MEGLHDRNLFVANPSPVDQHQIEGYRSHWTDLGMKRFVKHFQRNQPSVVLAFINRSKTSLIDLVKIRLDIADK